MELDYNSPFTAAPALGGIAHFFPIKSLRFDSLQKNSFKHILRYLPPYEVITNEEILLRGFSGQVYQKFSRKLPPTHQFPTSGSFVAQEKDPKLQKHLVYPLPPGYYRKRSKVNDSNFQSVRSNLKESCQKINTIPYEYKKRVSNRPIYFIQEGFFYHNDMIYCLPAGWIVPNTDKRPVFLTALACYRPWLVLKGDKNPLYCFTQKSYLKVCHLIVFIKDPELPFLRSG